MAVAVVALACLSGCGGGPGGPSSGGIFSSATSLFGGSTKIAVAPIIGATPEVAQQLTDALVAAGKDRDLTILPAGSKANYTLRGYLIASSEEGLEDLLYLGRERRQGPARGAGLGRRGRRRTRAGGDPWANVDSTAINSIAGKTTSQLAASLPRGGGSASAVAAASDAAPAATAQPRRRPRPVAAPRPTAWWWRPLQAPPATAAVADHGAQEAALCRRR